MSSEPLPQCEFDADDLLVRVDMTIPADLNAITPAVNRIMEIVREMGCAAGAEMDVEIAVREALVNAVTHGSGNDPSKSVQCCVACDQSRGMLIVVRDAGPGFDPSKLPNPVVGQNVYAAHGRGIYLINQLMDEVRFERGGTEIHMRKRPPAPKEPPR